MFTPDIFDPISFYIHIFFGLMGLAGALAALATKKGSKSHIWAGRLMFIGIMASSITTLIFMGVKFSAPPILNSISAICGLTAAILTFQKANALVVWMERAITLMLLVLVVWFLSMAIPNILNGSVIFIGPLSLVIIPVAFLIGDFHFYKNQKLRGKFAVRRHMTRMVWSLVIAIRAPMFELRDELNLALPVVLIFPLLLGVVLQFYFWKKAQLITFRFSRPDIAR